MSAECAGLVRLFVPRQQGAPRRLSLLRVENPIDLDVLDPCAPEPKQRPDGAETFSTGETARRPRESCRPRAPETEQVMASETSAKPTAGNPRADSLRCTGRRRCA